MYPVMLGYNVYKNFVDTGPTGDIPMPPSDLKGGHAVCAIGYDDAHVNLDGSNGALLNKNSWGTSWGCAVDGTPRNVILDDSDQANGGYFWMPYSFILADNSDFCDCWAIIKESDFPVKSS
jgi:C1A family cysteine protease